MADAPTPPVADQLSALIRIPTVSAHAGRTGVAPFESLMAKLAELFPAVHEHLACERLDEVGWLFRWPGSDPALAREPVVLMAHTDVVPVDEADAWTHPPFDGVIADGRVYGRGSLDDKGALVVLFAAVESLVAAGFRPRRDVYLSIGGNEEIFGPAAATIAATMRGRGLCPWLVLDEGGAVVDAPLPFVAVPAAMIGVGEKGVMTVTASTRTEPGHSSAPGRFTAVSRLARAIDRIRPTVFPVRMPSAIAAMLACFLPHTTGAAKAGLTALVKAPDVAARVFAGLGGEPAALVRTTVAATMIEGGTASNVLPSSASATLNLRVAIGETTGSVMRQLRRAVHDPAVTLRLVEGSDPSPLSPTDGPPYAALVAAVRASYPEAVPAPYVMMAATDSRHFHAYAPAVYRFAPLAMTAAQRASIHGIDEWVGIDALERGVAFYRHLIQAV